MPLEAATGSRQPPSNLKPIPGMTMVEHYQWVRTGQPAQLAKAATTAEDTRQGGSRDEEGGQPGRDRLPASTREEESNDPQQSKQVQNQAVAQIHKGLHHTRWGETWQSTQQPHKAEPHDSTPRGTGSTRSPTDRAKLLWPANQRSQNSDSHHHSRSNSRETKQFHTGTLTTTTQPQTTGERAQPPPHNKPADSPTATGGSHNSNNHGHPRCRDSTAHHRQSPTPPPPRSHTEPRQILEQGGIPCRSAHFSGADRRARRGERTLPT